MVRTSSVSPILEILNLLIDNDEDGIRLPQIVDVIGCTVATATRNLKHLESKKMAYYEKKGTAKYWRSYLHRESKE